MTLEERKIQPPQVVPKSQQLTLSNREKLTVTGVSDVLSFSESLVQLDTNYGRLSVRGDGLKIQRLDVEDGELTCEGKISALEYSRKQEKKSLFETMFR